MPVNRCAGVPQFFFALSPATFNDAARLFCMTRPVLAICFAAVVLLSGMVAAAGFEPTSGVLTEHEKMLKYRDQQPAAPYAMNYTDEAAQTIGVRDGRWNVINSSRRGFVPNVSGAIDSGRPMLKLQWRVGQ